MSKTLEGFYKNGKIELLCVPAAIREGRVKLVLLEFEGAEREHVPLPEGKYYDPNGRMSTEEDFKIAEWPGDRNLDEC